MGRGMDWIRALPSVVFWWGWGMVTLLAAGALYATWWARRNVTAIGAQNPVQVSDLAEGYCLVWGRTVGPALTAEPNGCWFSGEREGFVTSHLCLGSSTSVSTKNSAAPFITG